VSSGSRVGRSTRRIVAQAVSNYSKNFLKSSFQNNTRSAPFFNGRVSAVIGSKETKSAFFSTQNTGVQKDKNQCRKGVDLSAERRFFNPGQLSPLKQVEELKEPVRSFSNSVNSNSSVSNSPVSTEPKTVRTYATALPVEKPVQNETKKTAKTHLNAATPLWDHKKPALTDMTYSRFSLPKFQESQEEYNERLSSQEQRKFKDRIGLFGKPTAEAQLPTAENTTHSLDMLVGFYNSEKGLRRFVFKRFPKEHGFLAAREMVVAQIAKVVGEDKHFIHTSVFDLPDGYYIGRRFVNGVSATNVIARPHAYPIENIKDSSFVKMFAFVNILCGENDFNNPGNLVFTFGKSHVTEKNIVPIDTERAFGDSKQVMDFLHSLNPKFKWVEGTPAEGTFDWRRKECEELGEKGFFDALLEAQVPYLKVLEIKSDYTKKEMANLEVPMDFVKKCVESRNKIEQLLLMFKIYTRKQLESDTLSFQKVLDQWKEALDGYEAGKRGPLTLFEITVCRNGAKYE